MQTSTLEQWDSRHVIPLYDTHSGIREVVCIGRARKMGIIFISSTNTYQHITNIPNHHHL